MEANQRQHFPQIMSINVFLFRGYKYFGIRNKKKKKKCAKSYLSLFVSRVCCYLSLLGNSRNMAAPIKRPRCQVDINGL